MTTSLSTSQYQTPSKQALRQSILQQVNDIPKGHVCTYGDIAKRAGFPGYARYVGTVLRSLPECTTLPWHRVINGQGKISLPMNSPEYNQQKQRLEQEGIVFLNNKVDLKIFRANPYSETL